MNDRYISIDHDKVTSALASLESELNQCVDAFDELEARVAVLRNNWDGDAQRAFDDAHRTWDAALRRMAAIAHAMHATASDGNARFRAQDIAAARSWQV